MITCPHISITLRILPYGESLQQSGARYQKFLWLFSLQYGLKLSTINQRNALNEPENMLIFKVANNHKVQVPIESNGY